MLKNTFRTIDKTFGFIEDWSLFLTVIVALGVAVANIFLRKLTNINLYWSDEVVRKVIYFSTYMGCVAAIRGHALIRIDALPQLFPKTKRLLTAFNHLAMIGFGLLMMYLGWQLTCDMYADTFAKTTTLQIPEWYFYAVLPLMGLMSTLRSVIVMVEDWRETGNS